METDPFNRSRYEASADNETDDDSSSSSKKKKKARQSAEASAEADKAVGKRKEEAGDKTGESANAETLWQRLIRQTAEKTEKAEKSPETDAVATGRTSETETAQTPEADEGHEVPLEALSPEEQTAVLAQYIEGRQAELAQEQDEAMEANDPTAAAENMADMALLEATLEQLRNRDPEQPLEEPLQIAYENVRQRLAMPEEMSVAEAELTPLSAAVMPNVPPRPQSRPAESLNDDTPTEGPPSPLPPVVVAWHNSQEMPAESEIFRRQAPPAESAHVGAPAVPGETAVPKTVIVENAPNRTGSALLLGGVVGYLVGRRRGRIKTEKRLKTVEKKLTAEVGVLQRQIVQKEQQIRHTARTAYSEKQRIITPESPPTMRINRPEIATDNREPNAAVAERVPRRERLGLGLVTLRAAESAPGLAVLAPEKKSKKGPTEEAGKRTERLRDVSAEKPAKRSEMMDRAELLEAGAAIAVGATNLRRVFETHLISEQGLRRLVHEHERGGDVRAALRQELVEKEKSYERDPHLRNRSRTAMGSMAASAVVRANIDKPAVDADVAQPSSATQPKTIHKGSALSSTKPSQSAAVAGGVALVVIIAILLYLLFTGRSL